MALRDQLTRDRAVFLNLEEFGTAMVINGVPVTAVRDDDLTIQRTQGPPQAEGLFAQRTVLHLAAGLITRPVESQRLNVDGRHWYVRQVAEAEGMLELTLELQEA